MDPQSIMLQHLLLSLVPWIVGSLTGGGLGYVLALALRTLGARPSTSGLNCAQGCDRIGEL